MAKHLGMISTETGGQQGHLVRSVEVASMEQSTFFKEGEGSSDPSAVQSVQGEPATVIEMCIEELSSVSLGKAWGEKKESYGVKFQCSMCEKKKELGINTGVMVRVMFSGSEMKLCERCCNILVDVLHYGPRVISEGFQWRLRSKFLRASAVHDDLVCGQCLQRRSSHMFVKMRVIERTRFGGEKHKDISLRRCSRCVYSYIDSMKTMEAWREKYPSEWD